MGHLSALYSFQNDFDVWPDRGTAASRAPAFRLQMNSIQYWASLRWGSYGGDYIGGGDWSPSQAYTVQVSVQRASNLSIFGSFSVS